MSASYHTYSKNGVKKDNQNPHSYHLWDCALCSPIDDMNAKRVPFRFLQEAKMVKWKEMNWTLHIFTEAAFLTSSSTIREELCPLHEKRRFLPLLAMLLAPFRSAFTRPTWQKVVLLVEETLLTLVIDKGRTLTQQTIQLPPRADGGWIKHLFTRGENACYIPS